MRRKAAAFLVLSFFLVLPASAQGMLGFADIGVKGGVSFATLPGEFAGEEGEPIDFGYSTGFVGGLFGEFTATPIISPRIEVLYVQKGGTTDDVQDAGVSEGEELNYNIAYIEIPVLLTVNPPLIGWLIPNFYVGPYVGFAIDRSVTLEGEAVESISGEAVFDTIDYGLTLGTAVDFTFAGRTLTLSGRYDFGLANIAAEADEIELNTGTFMVTLGFAL